MRNVVLTSVVPLMLAGCSGLLDSTDEAVPESALTFIRVAADAPPLAANQVSFWIVRGRETEVEIRYQNGSYNGKCLLFRVPANAPLRYPDGRLFQPGDSARVTIRVVDPQRFIFHFDPAGLKFDPAHPAQLEVRHRWADADFNGDGVRDSRDERIERNFGFWRQERPGEPWTRISTSRLHDVLEARATVTGFTIYALASD